MKLPIQPLRPYLSSLLLRPVSAALGPAPARVTMSTFSQMSGSDPDTLEKGKNEALERKYGGEWNEKLASESEAAVKSDRHPDRSIAELYSHTIAVLHPDATGDHRSLENDVKSAAKPVIESHVKAGGSLKQAEQDLLDEVFAADRPTSSQVVEQAVLDTEEEVILDQKRG
ncbi:hypothetical protein BC937DRAFT_92783 [Endogone sp. FLAS-F59071]|nr:hypothetical protein BC937DRAFT_92783 [Endogone sp. FLAS-F59071]|eukprot:RUS15183.1 hypothetical protein BC937DRAFT_92783 [Endogone sp. FLAS-F59071]